MVGKGSGVLYKGLKEFRWKVASGRRWAPSRGIERKKCFLFDTESGKRKRPWELWQAEEQLCFGVLPKFGV